MKELSIQDCQIVNGGAAEGFISNSSQGIKSSLNSSSICNNQPGSNYGDGCNYQ
ncbi:hypothetical protein EDC51_103145 [Bibersteinia trehalosi]|uniref:hypothetical protein n=1 Tax=Bibersteinia trehalosi TaxID=47735 RepID=UPI0010D854A8|nr:hypothetical protein [Bibersteinia trehalosi]TCT17392.1 hypothetical protein EDC51_103145 [Bibersteinia trehalosi]